MLTQITNDIERLLQDANATDLRALSEILDEFRQAADNAVLALARSGTVDTRAASRTKHFAALRDAHLARARTLADDLAEKREIHERSE